MQYYRRDGILAVVGASTGGTVGSGGSGSAGSGTGSPSGPIHDVSVRIMGPAVMDIQQNFIELWNSCK